MTHSHVICVTTISCYCFHNLWLKVNCVSNFLLTEIFRRGLDAIHESTVRFHRWFPLLESVIQPAKKIFQELVTLWLFTMQSGQWTKNAQRIGDKDAWVKFDVKVRPGAGYVGDRLLISQFTCEDEAKLDGFPENSRGCMVNDQSVNRSEKNLLGGMYDTFT